MPPALVKTPLQEVRWDRAKEIVREQTKKPQSEWGDNEYGLTVHIMQGMKWYPDDPPKKRRKKAMSWKLAFEKLALTPKPAMGFLAELQAAVGVVDKRVLPKLAANFQGSVLKLFEEDMKDWKKDIVPGADDKYKIISWETDKIDVSMGTRPATHWDPPEDIEGVAEFKAPSKIEGYDEFEFSIEDLLSEYLKSNAKLLALKNPRGAVRILLPIFKKHSRLMLPWMGKILEGALVKEYGSNDDQLEVFLTDNVEYEEQIEWDVSIDSYNSEIRWSNLNLLYYLVTGGSVAGDKLKLKTKFAISLTLDPKQVVAEPYDDRDYDDDRDGDPDDPRNWGPY